MTRARGLVGAVAAGAVTASLVLLPAAASAPRRVPTTGEGAGAATSDGPRIAFTDESDGIEQVRVVRSTPAPPESPSPSPSSSESPTYNAARAPARASADTPAPTYTSGPPEDGPVPGSPKHEGELSGSDSSGTVAYVSTADDEHGEVYAEVDGFEERVTCNSYVETHPVMLSDLRVAWAARIKGNWDIYVAEWDGRSQTHVAGTCDDWDAHRVTDSPANDLWPAFDDTGRRIVFSSTRKDPRLQHPKHQLANLWAVDAMATKPETHLQRLTRNLDADTQPTVAVVNGSPWVVYTSTRRRRDGSLRVLPLVPPGSKELRTSFPLWSGYTPQSSEPAVSGGATAYLAFTTRARDPYGDIWMGLLTQTRGEDHPRLVDEHVVTDRPGIAETHASWYDAFDDNTGELTHQGDTDDVAVVTFTARTGDADVSTADASRTSRSTPLAHDTWFDEADEPPFDEAGPAYSPDGETVVYSRDILDGAGRELVQRAADGTGPAVPVGETRDYGDVDVDPVWSPDGTMLAFTRYPRDGEGSSYGPPAVLVTTHPGGEDSRTFRVTPEPEEGQETQDANPSWSPDSRHLIVSRSFHQVDSRPAPGDVQHGPDLVSARRQPDLGTEDHSTLWVLDVQGSDDGRVMLQTGCPDGVHPCPALAPVAARDAAWSPVGDRVVYSNRGALSIVTLTGYDAGTGTWTAVNRSRVTGFYDDADPTPSLNRISWADDPAWSPDGTEIAFDGQPAGQPDQRGIYAIRPDGTGLRTVSDDRGPQTEPAWSPGTDVAVTVQASSSSVTQGEPVTVTYTVSNASEEVADGVTLTTTFSPGGSPVATSPPAGCAADGSGCSFGTLEPGESRQYAVTLTYSPSGGTPAREAVTGTVTTTSRDVDLGNNQASVTIEVRPPPPSPVTDVSVTVTVAGSPADPGTPVTATYVVTNSGESPAADVALATRFTPGGTTTADNPPTGCETDGSGCAIGTLDPGATLSYVVTVTYPDPGDYVAAGTVTTSTSDDDHSDDEASAPIHVTSVDVSVTISLDGPRGWVGGRRLLHVEVHNLGTDPAHAVTLALGYPTDLVAPAAAKTCLDGSGPPCDLGDVPEAGVQSFDVPMRMLAAGTGRITAVVATTSVDADPTNDTASVSLKVLQPTVRLLPAVGRPGTVTMAYGENMPPGTRVRVRWQPGITVDTGPYRVAEDGTLRAPLVLVRHDLLGSREVVATSTSHAFSEVRGPMLVLERLATPPDLLSRG